jgi:hypothetical protein
MKIPLEVQVSAVERAVVNLRGHIDILRELVSKKKRDTGTLEVKESWLPQLEAALATLKWLEKHESSIKNALKAQK